MDCVKLKCFLARGSSRPRPCAQLSDIIGVELVAYEVCRLWFWKECLGYFYSLGQPRLYSGQRGSL